MRKLIAAAIVAALTLTGPAALATNGEQRMKAWVNHSRLEYGLRPLEVAWGLRGPARQHSAQMAEQNRIFHSSGYGCSYWGENVGAIERRDHWVRRLHRAFMASSAHRRNILDPAFTRVGIGIVRDGRVMYATIVFTKGAC